MGVNAGFFTALLLHFVICAVIAQGGYYNNEVECRLLPTQNDISYEFRLKASEKGVRLVYLNLKIGNDSYHPLELQDEFLPDRWVWANNITEPMLSFPDDYDILSLGLLNYQVRSMDVHLEDQPSGCLANLNSTLQNMAVGRLLLENVTSESSADQLPRKHEVVCVSMIQDHDVHRRCCGIKTPRTNQPNESSVIQCDLPIEKSSDWYYILDGILTVVSVLITYYLPAFPLVLPDYIFSLEYECDKEDREEAEQIDSGQVKCTIRSYSCEEITNDSREEERVTSNLSHGNEEETGASEIPVDDSSPVTCSALLREHIQKLPDSRLSFNIKLAVMLFCILPCVFYVQMGLWLTLKNNYNHEIVKKQVQLPGQPPYSLYIHPVGFLLPYLYALPALVGLALVLFLRPKDLLFRHDMCSLCKRKTFLTIPLHTVDFPRKSSDSIGKEILCHLRRLHQLPTSLWTAIWHALTMLYNRTMRQSLEISLSMANYHASRVKRAGYVLYVLLFTCTITVVALFGVTSLNLLLLFAVPFLLLMFSPFLTLSLLVLQNGVVSSGSFCTGNRKDVSCRLVMAIFVIIIFPLVGIPLVYLLFKSTSFVVYMLRFIMIGLYLNTDTVMPFVAFFLVMTTNLYLCYGNLQKRYKEFKGLILKYRQKTLNTSNGDQDTIPTSLFWFVSDRVLPIATEIWRMLCNMALIMVFSSLFLSAVLFVKDTNSISAYMATVSVFVSGAIPGLFFKGITKGKVFIGREKIKMNREIGIAVEEFDGERNGANRDSAGMESLEMSSIDQV